MAVSAGDGGEDLVIKIRFKIQSLFNFLTLDKRGIYTGAAARLIFGGYDKILASSYLPAWKWWTFFNYACISLRLCLNLVKPKVERVWNLLQKSRNGGIHITRNGLIILECFLA
jgi:hypothetical protein